MTDNTKHTDATIERLNSIRYKLEVNGVNFLHHTDASFMLAEIDRLQSELHEMREREMTEEKARWILGIRDWNGEPIISFPYLKAMEDFTSDQLRAIAFILDQRRGETPR